MSKYIDDLVSDLKLNHEYCTKQTILAAATVIDQQAREIEILKSELIVLKSQEEGCVSVKDLQKIINGDYQRARKSEQCRHGRYGYEDCESCVEEQIELLINAAQHKGDKHE